LFSRNPEPDEAATLVARRFFQRLNLGKYPIGKPSRRRLLAGRSGAALFAAVLGAGPVSLRPLAPDFSDLFGSLCDCKWPGNCMQETSARTSTLRQSRSSSAGPSSRPATSWCRVASPAQTASHFWAGVISAHDESLMAAPGILGQSVRFFLSLSR
jgi:hypothetical protein